MGQLREYIAAALLCVAVGVNAQQARSFDELEAQEEFRYGVLAYHAGHYNDALLAFQRAVAVSPDQELVRRWLGRAYAQSGFWDAALGEWQQIREAGEATLSLLQRIEIMNERTGIADLLVGRERFVMAAAITGNTPEYTLFRRPTSVRPLPDGTSIVVGFGNHTAAILDASGNIQRELLGGVGGLDGPYDVLPLPDGDFLVTEFMADRVSRLNARGNRIATFGERGTADGQFLGPQHMTIDHRNHVYITDWGNRVVRKFDADGTYLFTIGRSQHSYNGLRRPTGVVWWNDELWIVDAERSVLDVFDESGNYLRTVQHDELSSPQSVAAFDDETLLIADSNRLLLFRPDSNETITINDSSTRMLTAAARDANGNIVAADHGAESLVVFTQVSQLYAGMHVTIQRISADAFPEVSIDVLIEDRAGNPVVGLDKRNFVISDAAGSSRNIETVFQGWRSETAHWSMLIDTNVAMMEHADSAANAIERMYAQAGSNDTFRVVSALENPVKDSDPAVGALTAAERVRQRLQAAEGGRLDTAIRLSADEVLQTRGRRQVVLVTVGGTVLPEFETYGIIELSHYYQQNHILFSVLQFGSGDIDEQLRYLVEETGGTVVRAEDARGIHPLLEHAYTAPNGWYTLRYNSRADSDFGRRFLPLSVEALLLQRSGRDELGFFAPLEF